MQNRNKRGPLTLELFAEDTVPLDALVGVSCIDTSSDLLIGDYNYKIDSYDWTNQKENDEVPREIATIDIRSIWSENSLQMQSTGLSWYGKTLQIISVPPLCSVF
jgi:hypothetical protein